MLTLLLGHRGGVDVEVDEVLRERPAGYSSRVDQEVDVVRHEVLQRIPVASPFSPNLDVCSDGQVWMTHKDIGKVTVLVPGEGGYRVAAVGRGPGNAALAKKLGAELYIDSAATDPAAELQ